LGFALEQSGGYPEEEMLFQPRNLREISRKKNISSTMSIGKAHNFLGYNLEFAVDSFSII